MDTDSIRQAPPLPRLQITREAGGHALGRHSWPPAAADFGHFEGFVGWRDFRTFEVGERVVFGAGRPVVADCPVHVEIVWPRRIWRVGHFEKPGPALDEWLARGAHLPAAVNELTRRRCWWDAFTVLEEIPAWRWFGQQGQGVAEVLDAISLVDAARVRGFDWPDDLLSSSALLEEIPGGLDRDAAAHAISTALLAVIERLHAVDPSAGMYRDNNSWSYEITDPAWRALFEAAALAAVAPILEPWTGTSHAADLSALWRTFAAR